MSLFDLQDVRIAIGSIATLDLPMVGDLIGIYGLKGSYCTLTTTNWFLQAVEIGVAPLPPAIAFGKAASARSYNWYQSQGHGYQSQGHGYSFWPSDHSIQFWKLSRSVRSDRRSGYDEVSVMEMNRMFIPSGRRPFPPLISRRRRPCAAVAAALVSPENCSGQIDEENPSTPISSGLLVQADEGVSFLVVDRIDVIYHRLP
ncbi:3-isopropylmalate dehydrogenase 2 [Dorcoceras hygrometricum]|uniref:3-isopropylmalate dehydrogenase 2 n=1 Tax=Dorcoceras hygrometricum TaxID=472368 RepID=A0A2Z7ARS6_9LAMI|nr:3-isopropylmalate dehydrogenase 2 [Dorcoceras hygrometricum]